MATAWARDRATLFYLGFGLLGLGVVALGFGVTYAAPMVRRTFDAPWFVHVHGATALGWVLLLILQARLVQARSTPVHRRLGQVALPLAVAVWASGIATAHWAARRDLPELGTVATSSMAGTISGLTIFMLVVIAAVAMRHRTDWHKRLVMLATIQLLWPAFFRLRHWLPAVPDPELWLGLVLAYAPIGVAAVRDQLRFGKVHPVWWVLGPVLVLEQSLEFALFDRGPMQRFGQWVFALLG